MFLPYYDGFIFPRFDRLARPASGALLGWLAGDAFVWLPERNGNEPCVPGEPFLARADSIAPACHGCWNVLSCLPRTATSPMARVRALLLGTPRFLAADSIQTSDPPIVQRIRETLLLPLAAIVTSEKGAVCGIHRETAFDFGRESVLRRLELILASPDDFDFPPPFPYRTKQDLRRALDHDPDGGKEEIPTQIRIRVGQALDRILDLPEPLYSEAIRAGLP